MLYILSHLGSLIFYSQYLETGNSVNVPQMINKNENVIHIHIGILFSCKKTEI